MPFYHPTFSCTSVFDPCFMLLLFQMWFAFLLMAVAVLANQKGSVDGIYSFCQYVGETGASCYNFHSKSLFHKNMQARDFFGRDPVI